MPCVCALKICLLSIDTQLKYTYVNLYLCIARSLCWAALIQLENIWIKNDFSFFFFLFFSAFNVDSTYWLDYNVISLPFVVSHSLFNGVKIWIGFWKRHLSHVVWASNLSTYDKTFFIMSHIISNVYMCIMSVRRQNFGCVRMHACMCTVDE